MKLQKSLLLLFLFLIMGVKIAMANEFIIHGIKGSAKVDGFEFELTGVSLEESDQGAAINISMQLVDGKGITEKLHLTIPSSPRTGLVETSHGVISLKHVDGLDQYFYKSPEKIIWSFEFLPGPVKNLKTHLYKIDGKLVSEEIYHKLFKTLTGQEHWYCAETVDGGDTVWESKDPSGRRYRIVEKSGKIDSSSITQIPQLKP
jgi:hypothetical protein